jgi:hypothetical protein
MSAISVAASCTTYLAGSSSERAQTIGPATAGGSVSGAERLLCTLCRLSIDDLALKLAVDMIRCPVGISVVLNNIGSDNVLLDEWRSGSHGRYIYAMK